MSATNNFAAALEKVVVALLQIETGQPSGITITRAKQEGLPEDGETAERIQILPRVVVAAENPVEAIYQTGIYSARLTIDCLTDIDSRDNAAADALLAWVANFLQRTDLKTLLMSTHLLFIHGLGSPSHTTNQVGDRQWAESVSLDVIGYAT